jgi:predicted ATPase with chaperone activity
MFLFGSPGNGKSTIAKRITACFGQETWIPRAIIEDDQIIKLHDSSYHTELRESEQSVLKTSEFDRRWIRIKRPTVTVGGELTLDNLEIRHDPINNVSEAPLQLKSNGGCLLIDDFGRQRLNPAELLNRWIVPLECGYDFLTLATGKKIQVPFEQLIIFSTNLEPRELVDEAFLRRIPYKIEIADPDETEFLELFQLYANQFGCEYREECVKYLVEEHYKATGQAMRRCHPRDLLKQMRNYCRYRRLPFEMRPEYFDRVVNSYFAVVFGQEKDSALPWRISGLPGARNSTTGST